MNYFYSHDWNSYDLPCCDIFLQIIVVTLYEQLAVRLCLTSILTIAFTGNNQRMWGGNSPFEWLFSSSTFFRQKGLRSKVIQQIFDGEFFSHVSSTTAKNQTANRVGYNKT